MARSRTPVDEPLHVTALRRWGAQYLEGAGRELDESSIQVRFVFREGRECVCGGQDPSCWHTFRQDPGAVVEISARTLDDHPVAYEIDADDFDFVATLQEIFAFAGVSAE